MGAEHKKLGNINGWVLTKNIEQLYSDSISINYQYAFTQTGGIKFPDDMIWLNEDKICCYLEGFIVNKQSLMKNNNCEKWENISREILLNPEILRDFRGGFCGFVYSESRLILFNDQMGNRAIYYYYNREKLIVSSRWNYVVDVMRQNQIAYGLSEMAVRYMLTYGYMLDETTFANEIKRILPGHYVEVDMDKNAVRTNRYYLLQNEPNVRMEEREAVEIVDYYFRKAIKREFEKDKENQYKHLTDLSGGLDSRMTTWVAHEMGYTEQLNITYCKKNYLDFIISQDIAAFLKHEFIFKSLDDFKWFGDMDIIVGMNNGAALYSGISGGRRLLEQLNVSEFGIEHTGMVGDAVVSTFFRNIDENYEKPKADMLRYSNKLECAVPRRTLEQYENAEQFALYTRGLLGAQASYFIRQNYLEVSSPFLDVDFMNAVFQIPFQLRKEHRLYLEWIKGKYPGAAKYGWERWCGIRPVRQAEWKKYIIYGYRRVGELCKKIMKMPNQSVMAPFDYYIKNDKEMRCFVDNYYLKYINSAVIPPELKKDIGNLYATGNAGEKAQALTVLAIVRNFFVEK